MANPPFATPAKDGHPKSYNGTVLSADGTVHPLYTGQTSSPIGSIAGTSGETGIGSTIDTNRGKAIYPTDTTTYYVADHLGSSRMVLSGNGYPVWSGVFLPFGQEWNPQITMNTYKFTGDQRDSESNLDHTWFRQYEGTQGRWLSPDPYLGSMDLTNPQSLNRYAYVTNSPASANDPTGLVCSANYGLGETPCNNANFGGGGGSVPGGIFGNPLDMTDVPVVGPGSLRRENGTCADCDSSTLWSTVYLSGPFEIGGTSGVSDPNNGPPKQQQCLATVQGAVNSNLGTQSIPLGPTVGPGLDANGMRGGAYNYNFFAPGVTFGMPPGPNSVPHAACGRFSGGLHVPVPYWPCNVSGDPVINGWGPGVYNGMQGSYLTAHMDSSDPFQDLYSFFAHIIANVILQRKHGC